MSQQSVKISEGGKLVIPAHFRRALGVATGDTVIVEMMPDGDLRIRPISAAIKTAQAIVRAFAGDRASLAQELIAERRQEAARE